MSYTILWCKIPYENESWRMKCGVKGVYPTRKAAMDVIRKKFNDEVDSEVKRTFEEWKPGMTKNMIRGMIISDWIIEKFSNSMSWLQNGESCPVTYKVVKIPTERKKK